MLRSSPAPRCELRVAVLDDDAAARGGGGDGAPPPPTTLRLLPVSGGIFAGRFSGDVPRLTHRALRRGYAELPEATQRALLEAGLRVELCVFDDDHVSAFRSEFEPRRPAAAASAHEPATAPAFAKPAGVGPSTSGFFPVKPAASSSAAARASIVRPLKAPTRPAARW